MFEHAGTDRSVMRQFLLDFEKLNGRRVIETKLLAA
jgi:hypothetical protein